ncbi:MAG: sensor histidine kinase [Aggregatilineales bacterium]
MTMRVTAARPTGITGHAACYGQTVTSKITNVSGTSGANTSVVGAASSPLETDLPGMRQHFGLRVLWGSLRVRLLLSYAVVLLLTLTVSVVALLLLLQTRAAASEITLEQLSGGLQGLVQRNLALPGSGPPRIEDRVERILTSVAYHYNVRILITDASGAVRYDSKAYDSKNNPTGKGFKIGGQVPFFGEAAYTPSDSPGLSLLHGTFQDPNGANWVYVRQAPIDASPDASWFVLAVTPPRTTLSEIVRYYGSDILLPVLEAGLIGLVAAIIFALLITRSVARPLQQVADTARAISQGELDRSAPVRGPAEVQAVAVAFNQMTQQVAVGQRAQRDFLANVSHDLRTPLTSIQGFSQAIIDGVAADPDSALRAATVIHDEAARMYRMVEELLDLARIEAGRFTMARHGVRIGEVVSAAGERSALTAQNKGVTLKTEVVPPMPVLAGDGDRLAQVFTNLVDNALKHTPTGGTITLHAEPQDNGVLITVQDTGEGIPAKDLPRVFERFYQVDKSRQRRDGAGLGLAIAGQIVAAHGGKIWVESQEGAWTRFSVWLPPPSFDGSTVIRRRADAISAGKSLKS